MFTKSVNTDFP